MSTQTVAVASDDRGGLQARVSAHFGRCPWFTLVRVEEDALSLVGVVANPAAANHQPGEIPAFVRAQGAEVILSGGMGGRAVALFERWGVGVATGASGTVEQALAAWLAGQLTGAAPCGGDPDHEHHHHGEHHGA